MYFMHICIHITYVQCVLFVHVQCMYMYTHMYLQCNIMQFKPEMVDLVYDCAKFKYECGNYTEASEYLYFYRVLVSTLLSNK